MAKFPGPVPLPTSVIDARIERKAQILSSAKRGVLIRVGIILFEFAGFLYFESYSLFMDALSSSVDVVFSIILIICIRIASRPPDEDHPFGHGRYEPLVGLQLGVFLLVIGGVMLFQQAIEFSTETSKAALDPRVWIFPFCALVLLEGSYQCLIRTAKKQNSPALAAEAYHYRIDALTSLVAMLALLAAAYYPKLSLSIDHIGAILISIFMIIIGIISTRSNVNQLLDRVPDQQYFDSVRNAALSISGVRDTEKIRIQLYGPDAHVDIDVEVDPELPVKIAHKISQEVRAEIQKRWPAVRDVTVHIEPFYPLDH